MRLLSATDPSVQQVALLSLLYLSDCPLFVATFAELAIVEPLLTLTCGAAQSSQVWLPLILVKVSFEISQCFVRLEIHCIFYLPHLAGFVIVSSAMSQNRVMAAEILERLLSHANMRRDVLRSGGLRALLRLLSSKAEDVIVMALRCLSCLCMTSSSQSSAAAAAVVPIPAGSDDLAPASAGAAVDRDESAGKASGGGGALFDARTDMRQLGSIPVLLSLINFDHGAAVQARVGSDARTIMATNLGEFAFSIILHFPSYDKRFRVKYQRSEPCENTVSMRIADSLDIGRAVIGGGRRVHAAHASGV